MAAGRSFSGRRSVGPKTTTTFSGRRSVGPKTTTTFSGRRNVGLKKATYVHGGYAMVDEVGDVTRRLPVYLLLDCSGSMVGDPIEAVRMGLRALRTDLQDNPQALETVWLSVITFAGSARQVVPLTEIGAFQEPSLSAGGLTALGDALAVLMTCIEKEVIKTTATRKADWKPLVFIMTDGAPTDDWEAPAAKLKSRNPANVIACAAGASADDSVLKQITDNVVRLSDTAPGTLGAFLKWVTASITTTSRRAESRGDEAFNVNDLARDSNIQIVP